MRIAQITDTHLSPFKPHFSSNWPPLREWLHTVEPDLVVHTGDLSVDGADSAEELDYCARLLDELPFPVLSIPGNHDIGDIPSSRQPVDAHRLERWRRLVGPDRWERPCGDWLLIGLNALVLGSGTREETDQFSWLAEVLASNRGRKIAVFTHKPLFLDHPDEGDTGYWGAPPRARNTLLELFSGHAVKLVASGHLHRTRIMGGPGFSCVWAPSSAFVVGPMQPLAVGDQLMGAALHTLRQTVVSEIVSLPALTPFLLDDVVDEVYPHATKEPA